MSNDNLFVYFQPNKNVFLAKANVFQQKPSVFPQKPKDANGDCTVRAVCKAENIDWLLAYDRMYCFSRDIQCVMNCKNGFEHIMKAFGYTYFPIGNKKGIKRPTVESFTRNNPTGTYILYTSNHYVCSKDGHYYDTWDSGSRYLYGYFKKQK